MADAIDDMKIRISRHGKGDGDEEEVKEESVSEFAARINTYVTIAIRMHPNRSRDQYKEELVYEARKNLIAEFFAATTLKKCENNDCRA